MVTASQRLYIEDVLGTQVTAYRRSRPPTPRVPTIVVLTPPLDELARALLEKILASIKLDHYRHVEGTDVVARHVLHFSADARPGRTDTESGVRWGFHPLDRLLGTGDEVVALKREVWTLLRAFAKEID